LRSYSKQLSSAAILCRIVAVALVGLTAGGGWAQGGPKDRIASTISGQSRVSLGQSVHPLARAEFDQGVVGSDFRIGRATLQLTLSDAQQSDLTQLLDEVNNPLSPNYHHWLKPEQFGQRFGASPSDLAKITAWLQSHGLTVEEVPAGATRIIFSGPASGVATAFGTEIHSYLVNGTSHFANAKAVTVPAELGGVVGGVRGLYNFRMKPRSVARRTLAPQFTSSITNLHFLAPDDFATIYNLKGLYNSGINGTGQSIAIAGQTDINLTDVEAFRAAAGLAANDPQKVLVGTSNPGVLTSDEDEANLDVEWSGAVAPKATIYYLFADPNKAGGVSDALQYAVDHNQAPVISISYGECEATATSDGWAKQLASLGQQANAQGQTIIAPSGDSGAADCDNGAAVAIHGLAVDMPASLPYVTGVGGTEFNEGTGIYWSASNNANNGSALQYIPEIAWNDSTSSGLSATGGGKSILYPKPAWQSGTGVPSDGMRDVPDVAFSASVSHDGYLICSQGSCTNGFRDSATYLNVIGGTSTGAPSFAGIVALLNQKMGAAQGNINSGLYGLASSSLSPFHDVTSGNNSVTCRSNSTGCPGSLSIGYSAGTGYDLATGLGSVDASALVSNWWGTSVTISPASSILTTTRGSSLTNVLTISSPGGYTIALTCQISGMPTGTTCGLSPTSLTGSGTSTLTVTVPATSAALRHPGSGWLVLGANVGFGIVGVVICGLGCRRKLARPYLSVVLGLCLVFAAAGVGLSCGGGSSSASSKNTTTGTVTVVANSQGVSHSVPITVTVN